MLRMRSKTRIEDLFHSLVLFKKSGKMKGTCLMFLHADFQGFQATKDKPAVPWCRYGSRCALVVFYFKMQPRVGRNDRTPYDIAVTAEIFGRAVYDNICTKIEWSLKIWA